MRLIEILIQCGRYFTFKKFYGGVIRASLFRGLMGFIAILLLNGCDLANTTLLRQPTFPIWPDLPPGYENTDLNEKSGFNSVTDVVIPTVSVFSPIKGTDNGHAILICPGGAFSGLSIIKEGTMVADRLAQKGITAFVLKYRVKKINNDDHPNHAAIINEARNIASNDVKQAIKYLRDNSKQFGIDPLKIGVIGFSAGAMAIMSSLQTDEITEMPNLVASIYGGIQGDLIENKLPPLFLAHAQDDSLVPIQRSVEIENIWLNHGADVLFKQYETGGHGFGAEKQSAASDQWFDDFEAWLASHDWL